MSALDDDIMRQLRATFQVEAAEHIQAMNRVLLALEANPEGEERAVLMAEIFREAHSLKGAAGAADFPDVEKTAHKLESVFGAAKAGKIKLTRDLADLLFAGIDALNALVNAAFEEKPHGIDLPSLYARLDAAEQGRVMPDSNPPPTASQAQALDAVTPPPAPTPPQSAPAGESVPAPAVSALTTFQGSPAGEPTPAAALPPEPPGLTRGAGAEPKAKGDERRKSVSYASPAEETIRVATSKLDALLTQSGELLVAGLKIDQRLHELEEIEHTLEDWTREWLKGRSALSTLRETEAEALRPLVRLLDLNQDKLRDLGGRISNLRRGFSRDALHLSRVTNDLGEDVMKVRMLPVATVFEAFPRLVRDLARENGKEVELKTEGAETELDRKVLEEIKDPLIHLLRNAVDHGIEPPAERVQAGKPRQGAITLRAFQKGNRIVIQVTDDGGGIDRAKVKQAALKAGLINADDLQTMGDDEALRLIFAPGLSTRTHVTGTSGRGVGMDVVRKNIEALQGQVDVDSTLGQGTTFTLTLPLTLATTQQLLVQVGSQIYGIPISAVDRIQRISQKDIATVSGRQAIVVDNEPVSLVPLAEVLEMANAEKQGGKDETLRLSVVILGSTKKRMAFLVDAVVGQQETVVKSLGKQLARVRNVAGATILGSGRVIMTLNPVDLMKSMRTVGGQMPVAPPVSPTNGKPSPGGKAKQATILVVDDSLSTRTLEKNILETAGYKVAVATDGREAMELLKSNGSFDLILADVLMPHMDGLELTAAVKKDPNWKKIPVVLVTSLDSREDKERGIEAGADAYLVKSNFDQANLLQTIGQLI